jgi:hypothetical protein
VSAGRALDPRKRDFEPRAEANQVHRNGIILKWYVKYLKQP